MKKGCGTVCGIMFDMPTGQIRAPETHRSLQELPLPEWKWRGITIGLRGWCYQRLRRGMIRSGL